MLSNTSAFDAAAVPAVISSIFSKSASFISAEPIIKDEVAVIETELLIAPEAVIEPELLIAPEPIVPQMIFPIVPIFLSLSNTTAFDAAAVPGVTPCK